MSMAVSSACEVFRKVFNYNIPIMQEFAVGDDCLNLVFKQVFASLVLFFHTVRENFDINLERVRFFLAFLRPQNLETLNDVFEAVFLLRSSCNQ